MWYKNIPAVILLNKRHQYLLIRKKISLFRKYIFSANKHPTSKEQNLQVCTLPFSGHTNNINVFYLCRYDALPFNHLFNIKYPIPDLGRLFKIQLLRFRTHSPPHLPEKLFIFPFKEKSNISHNLLIIVNCRSPYTRPYA